MITTNINGNAISQAFIDEIRSDSPRVIARLWHDGAEVECDIVRITIKKGSCGSESFSIGEVVGDLLTATVKNLSENIKDEKIECHIGAWTGSNYEYISMGVFTVSKVDRTRYQSEITAYSGIVADSGDDFDSSSLTPTIGNIAIRLQSDLNCSITFDNGIDTSLSVTESLEGLTDYEVLQVVATCCGGYAINDNQGNIKIKKYNATPTLDVDTGMMVNLPIISEKPYKVRNIGVLVSEATTDYEGEEIPAVYYVMDAQAYLTVRKQGTEYYLIDENGNKFIVNVRPEVADLYFKCEYMTPEIYEANIKDVVGYEYYPATIDLTLGDPRLEGSDVLAVTELDGQIYTVPCHKIIHVYNGGFTSEIVSANGTEEENNIGTTYPITEKIQNLSKQSVGIKDTAEKAYRIAGDTNQYFWFRGTGTDTGAHITEIPQEQWDDSTSPNYHSGGNLLARSNGVAVRDGLTELAQFGETVVIGKTDNTHIEEDYHSLKMIDKDGNTYMHVSDLRGSDGLAEASDKFVGDGVNREFYVNYTDAKALVSVKVDGVEVTGCTFTSNSVRLPSAPSAGAIILVTYKTDSRLLKAYTFGVRDDGVIGGYSLVEGYDNVASGFSSHAEGDGTTASGYYSHTEGDSTIASGAGSHAEGRQTEASGIYSHVEGDGTIASKPYAHAEGRLTKAIGQDAHAEGFDTTASGDDSHAGGSGTIAQGEAQTVIGAYNVPQGSPLSHVATDKAFIIGNGDPNTRSNAFSVDWGGNVDIAQGAKYKINGSDLSASDVGAVPSSGNGSMSGTLTVEGHATPIGYRNSGNGTKEMASGNTPIQISASAVTLTDGTWMLIGSVEFPYVSNTASITGVRHIAWHEDSVAINGSRVTVPAYSNVQGFPTRLQTITTVSITQSTNFYLYGYQDCGSTMTANYYWEIVRIC